jgi:poly-gamma-glutamate capsule biosynthesis protein CapA/YwtB (metallophosphatase superfamily)
MVNDCTAYRLVAMGDVMLDRQVGKHFKEKPEDFRFSELRTVLKGDDLIFLNLENPVGTRGVSDRIQDPNVTFRCHPSTLQVLKNIGVVVVSLGNNHMLDYGEEALVETLEHLDAAGIRHVGAGRNYEEANRPLVMEFNGRKIAFLSHVFIYSASTKRARAQRAGVSDYRIGKILSRISQLKATGHQVIVSLHWGIEYCFYPLPYQKQQARAMIDHGASLILGHGPHYPQGIERYKNGEIVYSLGNFIFDEPHRFANRSFIYGVEMSKAGDLLSRTVIPVRLVNHIPRLVMGKDADRFRRFILQMNEVYLRKPECFWKGISNIYFQDIINRIIRMRSIKFVFLPPLSFYFSVGIRNYFAKVSFKNVALILGGLFGRKGFGVVRS